jgi:predicted transcriptional regulator
MFKIKLILMLIILAGAAGGYAYVQKLRADNATLKINQSKLETAVSENNEVIEQQTNDLKKIRTTLSSLEEEKKKLQADKDNLSKKLGKHDIGELAEKKPGLVEKIINKASDSATRCLEIASGSPLTEEELNGTPNRECPSFWPSSTTTD